MQQNINDILEYTIQLISEFAKRYSLSPRQAYRYISRYGGINLIEENYDIMHTLTFADAVEGVFNYCNRNGGELQKVEKVMSETEYLIETMTIDLTKMYLRHNMGADLQTALDAVYNSEIYDKIIRPETNLMYQNPGYVYGYLENELRTGHL